MTAADVLVFLFANAPIILSVALFLTAAAIIASVADAKPGGMVPRTMDPAATWR
jgi:hypothetical protein